MNSTLARECGQSLLSGVITQLGWLFYLVKPEPGATEVPNYEVQIFPAIAMLMSVEQLVRVVRGKRASRLNDMVINLGAGLLFIVARVFLLSTVLRLFYFVHEYRIVDLPPTMGTWFLSLLLVEFVYYWVHRSLHEINLFWASHQFHHNAETIDVTTTLRDTIVDLIIYEFFPVPVALLIPPPIILVHMQFSLIYQVWLHTEVISTLGPLEWIINTPSQHRVHHGKNKHCIDKNFGALLMIWDRIFGTYQKDDAEKVVFGTCTTPYRTFDTITLHFYYYYEHLWTRFVRAEGVREKFRVLFSGPVVEKVDDDDLDLYDPKVGFWKNYYVMIHGLFITLAFYIAVDSAIIKHSHVNALGVFFYVLLALTSFGLIFDKRAHAPLVESLRCALYIVLDAFVFGAWTSAWMAPLLGLVRVFHFASIALWMWVWSRDVDAKHMTARWSELQKTLLALTLIASTMMMWSVHVTEKCLKIV